MGLVTLKRRPWMAPAFAGIALAILLCVLGSANGRAATVPLSITVSGNHFTNGAGQTIRLLGVNHTSSEYGCVDGFGYDDGHFDAADAAAIASWGANAVRIPLNEDCWLGINGQPNSSEGADPALTQAGYQQAIESYVADLNADGIYAILDLHWTAPGTQVAMEQQPMPDLDHSPAFWQSVATTFKSNPAVVFDVFNEPFDPTDPKSGDDQNQADKVSWDCWEDGGCSTADYSVNGQGQTARSGSTYQVAGLQDLVDEIRATGATQPVLTGGLDYANDLSQWATHAPDDPLDQEAASFHNYQGKACDNVNCWSTTIASVAAKVPVVTGEFDEDNFDEPMCADKTPSTFDNDYMNWADSAGVSYLAWGWIVETQDERDSDGCSAYDLIDDYSDYTPSQPNGVALHDHLATLASGGGATPTPSSSTTTASTPTTTTTTTTTTTSGKPPPPKLESFHATVKAGGASVGFALRSNEASTGVLSGQTVGTYAITTAQRRRHRVSLGTARFTLTAGRSKTVVLDLSRASRRLLSRQHKLKVQITITLTNSAKRPHVARRAITLRTPIRRRH